MNIELFQKAAIKFKLEIRMEHWNKKQDLNKLPEMWKIVRMSSNIVKTDLQLT